MTPPDSGAIPVFDSGPPPPPTGELDLLFVVDNSGTMTEEQAALTRELPEMMRAITEGDLDVDGTPESQPFDSVRVGVITSDMGVGGFTVPNCDDSQFGDDGVLRTTGSAAMAGCAASYPSFLSFGGDTTALAIDVACVAAAGTVGCGFQQQLEAPLKALSPAAPTDWTADRYAAPRFFQNTQGHGDRANDGFARRSSVLAIVMLTDSEDCSALDPELFNPNSVTYTAEPSIRCFTYGASALQPISRFVDGLLQLRLSPSRLVFFPIVGVPVDLQTTPRQPTNWEILVSNDPAIRDDRMEERLDPSEPSRLQPSCDEPGTGVAFPPVRIARVAQQLDIGGARAAVGSICQNSLQTPIASFLALLR